MGRSRYQIIDPEIPYFLTCTILAWLPIFTRPETVNIILNSLRFLQVHMQLKLYAYVILENHLHLIVQARQLPTTLQRFKSYTARTILDHLKTVKATTLLSQLQLFKNSHKVGSKYQLWQEGLHPQAVTSKEVLTQKIDYIHFNPVKRGYVDFPEQWRYSSARNYLNQDGLIEVYKNWG